MSAIPLAAALVAAYLVMAALLLAAAHPGRRESDDVEEAR